MSMTRGEFSELENADISFFIVLNEGARGM